MSYRHKQWGLSLPELLIALAIGAVLIGMAVPSWHLWLQNAQIRATAEAINDGLQLARVEALRRNAHVRFQFTSTLGADCELSTTVSNWVVSRDDPTGACGSTPSETSPRITQTRSASESGTNVVMAAGQSAIVFNGLGRQSSVDGVTPPVSVNINITNPAIGACVANSGKAKCLRIAVSPTGQIRLCDPALAGTDPQACP